jgi:RHS repeat-associated protein
MPPAFNAVLVNQIQIRLNARFTNSDSNNGNRPTFDIDQDGQARATTDALLIVRYLRGELGVALTGNATNPSGSRGISSSDSGATLVTKVQAIQGYLQGLCSEQPNGETITYFHNDLVGSPVAATNASRNIIWRESYRAYGDRLTNQLNNGTPSDRNSLHFSNKKTEALKGGATISYFQNRYYDPAIGRFLSVDPVHFKESNIHSFNRYAYANNNPYRFVDPDGNEAEEIEEKNLQYEGLLSKENAENAAQFWADKQVATGNVLYAIPGVIATAWASNGPEILGILAATRGGVRAPIEATVAARPSGFRKGTVQDAWENAAAGAAAGSKACPTCAKDVTVAPGKGRRDWDVDHQPKWKDRQLDGLDRKGVLDLYNKDTRLRCPNCNRSDNK